MTTRIDQHLECIVFSHRHIIQLFQWTCMYSTIPFMKLMMLCCGFALCFKCILHWLVNVCRLCCSCPPFVARWVFRIVLSRARQDLAVWSIAKQQHALLSHKSTREQYSVHQLSCIVTQYNAGCLQLLEILKISWNLIDAPGKFFYLCVYC